MLLGTFVDEVWWPSCGKLRECTRVGYESAYRCHIQPKWAGVDMESITANDIEEWLGSFNQAGAARKAWAVLREPISQWSHDNSVTATSRQPPATISGTICPC